ncbi:MAG TPA: glycosyltransferase family 1 protein [Candidatus Dormibacteraeota bacterium]|nr:glycosyltransferase family 1 protein [Candidatus Dormibacteraeota bacterium]
MKKIGLLLTQGPAGGGMFQYSQAVLSSLLALPRDEFALVVGYLDPAWRDVLPSQGAAILPLHAGGAWQMLSGVVMVFSRAFSQRRRWPFLFHPLTSEVERQQCDLWVFPFQDFWSGMFRVPAIVAVHDLMHRYERRFPEVSSWGRFRFRETYLRAVCRDARGILTDSELGKRMVHESYGAPLEKIVVLPYASRLAEAYGACHAIREKYALPEKYLFYPAQFWKHKNHLRLLQAVAQVRQKFPDVSLVLTGAKQGRFAEIEKAASRLGLRRNVVFPGYVPDDDLFQMFREARGLIMPTFFGPTNIPPLEAFALGCPVAASRVYAMAEQVGDAGLLFDPNSVGELASCIERLWSEDDLCRLLIERGKAKAALWGPLQFSRALHGLLRQWTGENPAAKRIQVLPPNAMSSAPSETEQPGVITPVSQ